MLNISKIEILSILKRGLRIVRISLIRTHSLEHEVKRPLYFTNITGHIEPILEQNEYCEDNVLNLKRHSWNMLFVRCLDLLRFSCNQ